MGGARPRDAGLVRTREPRRCPADAEDYVDFAAQVAERYKGRITAYQIWNEANTRSFYEGDWTALAS